MPLAILFVVGIAPRLATALQLRDFGQGGSSTDSSPIISLRLAPGARPLPDVAAAVNSLVAAREAAESELLASLRAEFTRTLENASNAIQGAVAAARTDDRSAQYSGAGALVASEGGAHGFEDNYASVRVGVERRAPAGGAALAKIQSIEKKQIQAESLMFEQARKDMRALTSVALAELSEHLARGVRASDESVEALVFHDEAMRAPADRADVRVVAPASPFPAVADLVEDMEKRLDENEEQARAKILGMMAKLIEAEADMVRSAFVRRNGLPEAR